MIFDMPSLTEYDLLREEEHRKERLNPSTVEELPFRIAHKEMCKTLTSPKTVGVRTRLVLICSVLGIC